MGALSSAPLFIVLVYWLPVALLIWRHVDSLKLSVLSINAHYFLITLLVSAVVAVLATALATLNVLAYHRMPSRMKQGLLILMMAGAFTGLLARNYGWINFIYVLQHNAFPAAEKLLYSVTMVLMVMTAYFLPLAFFVILQAEKLLSANLESFTKILGLTSDESDFFVALPILRRAMLIAALLTFSLAIGFYATPRMLGGGTANFVSNVVLEYMNLGFIQNASVIAAWLGVIGLILSTALAAIIQWVRWR